NYVAISTSFTNSTSHSLSVSPGDVVDWGLAEVFLEGFGMLGGAASNAPVNYVIATSGDFSAGYVRAGAGPTNGINTVRYTLTRAFGQAQVKLPLPAKATPPPEEEEA